MISKVLHFAVNINDDEDQKGKLDHVVSVETDEDGYLALPDQKGKLYRLLTCAGRAKAPGPILFCEIFLIN